MIALLATYLSFLERFGIHEHELDVGLAGQPVLYEGLAADVAGAAFDPNGDRFLNMTVTLQLRDANGTLSGISQQAVKVYPNKQCGFSY